MSNRRAPFVLVAALVCSTSLSAQKTDGKHETDLQNREIRGAVKVADDLAAGLAAPNALALAWVRTDVLKAQGNKQYLPFTVTIDQSRVSAPNELLYWRVVAQGGAAATSDAAPKSRSDAKDASRRRTEYPYEDVSFVPRSTGSGTVRISRAFTVPAGNYDVYVVARESTPNQEKGAPAPKTSVLRRPVSVPDFWSADLNTSSLIVAERIDPLPAPLTAQQQADRPYALGKLDLVPAWSMRFPKTSELSTFFLIYNSQADGANKPDVTVEYLFYAKTGDSEKFFNKTTPQRLNARTLAPQFDLASGHQLQSGQAVPLASFPEGHYRLEIKVIDELSNRSVTRSVNFTVTAGAESLSAGVAPVAPAAPATAAPAAPPPAKDPVVPGPRMIWPRRGR